ncbi:MAG TPA: hypothetical protein VFT22_27485 [Kofleriaceae bacterium]|nr:hypothetical protein [Kofleriaceae bacterium]
MPSTTGISAVPSERPGVEAQAGFVPGYFLSSATYDDRHRGDVIGQLAGLIEPDRWIGARGLIAGARTWGQDGDHAFEPFLGVRHRIDGDLALAAIGHGTVMRGAERGASYRATRAGGELALDARVLAPARWLALHGQAAVSATYLDARGTYCADPGGAGVDCDQDGTDRVIDGSIRGVFAAATATLAIDFGRVPDSSFHGLRLALLGSAGTMPQVRDGMQTDSARYVSLGLTLTLGLGNAR